MDGRSSHHPRSPVGVTFIVGCGAADLVENSEAEGVVVITGSGGDHGCVLLVSCGG
jgi:hypothetical protein